MAGQQPVKGGRERPYVPAIYVLLAEAQARKTWMPATSAGMTTEIVIRSHRIMRAS
jgi:hypothetical protein